MTDVPKLAYFTIIDGTQKDIEALSKGLSEIQKKVPHIEFLVSNDKVQLTDLKYLLAELYKLYKQYKKIKEKQGKK